MKKLVALLLACAMVLGLAACGSSTSEEAAAPAATEAAQAAQAAETTAAVANAENAVVKDDSGTVMAATKVIESEVPADAKIADEITVAINTGLTTVDPHVASNTYWDGLYSMVYSRLCDWDFNKNEMVLDELATTIEWADDTYQKLHIIIRDDAVFSTGDKLTAEDVQFSFDRITYAAMKNIYDHIEIVNDYEFYMYLNRPCASVIPCFSYAWCGIVSKKDVEAHPDTGATVGSGAYKFDMSTHVVDSSISLVQNETYFGTPGRTKKFNFVVIGNGSTRLISLQSGEINFMGSVSLNELEIAQNDPNLSLYTSAGLNCVFMAFNNFRNEDYENLNLRLATACAINRDDILLANLEPTDNVMTSMWDQTDTGYFDDYELDLSYNPEKAKEYLAKSDVKEFTCLVYSPSSYVGTAAQVIQEQLRQVGITMNIVETDNAGWKEAIKYDTSEYDAYLYSNAYMGIRPVIMNFITKDNSNLATLNDSRVNELTENLLGMEGDEYLAAAKEIQTICHDTGSYIPLYWRTLSNATTKGITNFKILPAGRIRYQDMVLVLE